MVRVESACSLLRLGDREGFLILLSALRDARPWIRMNAMDTLKKATGKDFGFLPDGPPDAREKSVTSWETWWNEQGRTFEFKPQ